MRKLFRFLYITCVLSTCLIAVLMIKESEDLGNTSRIRPKRHDPFTEQALRVGFSELLFYESSFFVEFIKFGGSFKRSRKDISALKDHQMIILDASAEAKIVFSVTLGQNVFRFQPESSYWTLGRNLAELNIPNKVNDETVRAVPSAEKFRFESKITYMFVLQKATNQQRLAISSLDYTGSDFTPKAVLTGSNLMEAIAETTVDTMLACIQQPCKPIGEDSQELLRKISSRNSQLNLPSSGVVGMRKYSLNLCSEPAPFSYGSFFHGKPTPGRQNDCEGFLIESSECEKEQGLPATPEDDDRALRTFEKHLACESNNKSPPSTTEKEMGRSKANWVITLSKWKTGNTAATVNRCKKYFSNNGKILSDESFTSWLRLNPTGNTCQMCCSACQLMYDLNIRPDLHPRPTLASHDGAVASTDPRRNDENLKIHKDKPTHRLALVLMEALNRKHTVETKVELLEKFEDKVHVFYRPTMRVLALAYAEIKAGTPFYVHGQLLDALEKANTQVGVLHRHPKTVVQVANMFSNAFRSEALTSLISSKSPFSIIIDGSTDVSNSALVACLLQFQGDGSLRTFFYGLLKVTRENAEQITSAIVNQVKQDDNEISGFETAFKSQLTAVVTDNANVMIGDQKSVFVLLRDYSAGQVISQPCYNHKLQLAFKKSLKSDVEDEEALNQNAYEKFQLLFKTNNKFYVFFNSWGSKRYGVLRTVCLETGQKCLRFKSYQDIRWAASHFEVSLAIVMNSIPAVEALKRLRNDPEETPSTKTKIRVLEAHLQSTFFMLCLREQLDILNVFKVVSLKFQRRDVPMIDMYDEIENMIEDLLKLKFEAGSYLEKFLDSCTCKGVCTQNRCNLNEVDSCRDLECGGIKLTEDQFKLVPLKPLVVDELVFQVHQHFPVSQLASFQDLDLRKYKVDESLQPPRLSVPNSFAQSFKVVGKFLGYSSENVQLIEIDFLAAIQEHGIIMQKNGKSVSDCLAQFLKIDPTNRLRDFVLRILAIPIGSAEAERVFSYMSKYKSGYRSLMSNSVLNDIISVKINGPPIHELNLIPYTKLFLQSHRRSDAKYSFRAKSGDESLEQADLTDFDVDDVIDQEGDDEVFE